jgi:hypothetical protein
MLSHAQLYDVIGFHPSATRCASGVRSASRRNGRLRQALKHIMRPAPGAGRTPAGEAPAAAGVSGPIVDTRLARVVTGS